MSDHDTLAAIAEQLGFEFSGQVDEKLMYGMQRLIPSDRRLGVEWVMRRQRDSAELVVARVAIRKDGNNTSRSFHETVLYFQQPGLRLPNLQLEPKKFTSNVTTGMMKLMGMPGVSFEEDGGFSKAYSVLSFQPETARELLTPEIRACLCERQGLTVRSESDRLVVCRARTDSRPEEIAAFVDEADDVLMLLVRRARQFPELGIVPDEQVRESIDSMGGLIGAVMRGRIVREDDINAFLDQPTPRPLTPVIRKHYFGMGSIFFYFLGSLLLFAGGPLIALLRVERVIPGLVAALLGLLPLAGAAILVLTFLYRRNWKRTLRLGDVCAARVTSVKSTNTQVNNRRQYRVTLEFEHAGGRRTSTINAYEPAVQKAHSLADSESTTRILVDPRNSRRLVWIDGLWQ